MCYEVKCSTCGKTTWGGCGRHVPSVYKRIPEGNHCLCNDWPGVKLGGPSAASASASTDDASQPPSSNCAIL